jgi:hypothetical protein
MLRNVRNLTTDITDKHGAKVRNFDQKVRVAGG